MGKVFTIAVVLIASVAGGGAGYFAKWKLSESSEKAGAFPKETQTNESDPNAIHNAHTKKPESEFKEVSYLKFSRQFVVPIVKEGRPTLMMIFDINVEIDDSASDGIYRYEPQLRDAMLAGLFKLASIGVLERTTEEGEAMREVKRELLTIAQEIVGDAAKDILLLDVGIQPY